MALPDIYIAREVGMKTYFLNKWEKEDRICTLTKLHMYPSSQSLHALYKGHWNTIQNTIILQFSQAHPYMHVSSPQTRSIRYKVTARQARKGGDISDTGYV